MDETEGCVDTEIIYGADGESGVLVAMEKGRSEWEKGSRS